MSQRPLRALNLAVPFALLGSAGPLALAGCGSDEADRTPDDAAAAGEAGDEEQESPPPATRDAASAPAAPSFEKVDPVPGEVDPAYQAIVDATDRTEKDRELDARRHPAELLTFIGVQPGWKVADIGAGSGYTTELLARAVGTEGVVYGHNTPHSLEKFVSESWPARLARPACQNVVRHDGPYETPVPPKATDLDAVTMLFTYHDAIPAGADRAAMNQALFDALKPGGVLVLADHHALPGSGLEAGGTVHRLEEDIARTELEAAGFVLDGEAQFLRDPSDDRVKKSYEIGFKTDRYLLRFKKPDA